MSRESLGEVRATELGWGKAQRVRLLSMSERTRVRVQRNNLDRIEHILQASCKEASREELRMG